MNAPEPCGDTRVAVRLGVCVDDFGLHEGANEAALALAAAGRVSALGCLVDAPAWPGGARALRRDVVGRVDIGLHLNLTEPFGQRQRCHSLAALVLRAYGGGLAGIELTAALRAQLDSFEDTLGVAPDFVDGHRHVHQLPGIRDAVIDELARRYTRHRPWLRNTRPARGARGRSFVRPRHVKGRIIGALGARRMQALAAAAGFPQNRHLLGVYDFGHSSRDYGSRLEEWLDEARDNDLLMCHPAAFSAAGNDPIAAARRAEYDALEGERFARALAARRIVITRLSGSLAAAPSG